MTNAITYLTFKINQNEIAKTLCILRDQKNNSCNGICVLNAKIKELNNLEKKHSSSISEKHEIVYLVVTNDFCLANFYQSYTDKNISMFCSTDPSAFINSTFRPPIA